MVSQWNWSSKYMWPTETTSCFQPAHSVWWNLEVKGHLMHRDHRSLCIRWLRVRLRLRLRLRLSRRRVHMSFIFLPVWSMWSERLDQLLLVFLSDEWINRFHCVETDCLLVHTQVRPSQSFRTIQNHSESHWVLQETELCFLWIINSVWKTCVCILINICISYF